MNLYKNIIIIILALVCLGLFIENKNNSAELSHLKNNLDKFEIEFANWDSGETLFMMRGIQGYDIGFGLTDTGRVFWHKIGRNSGYSTEPGVCSDTPVTKYAFRPSGCFIQSEQFTRFNQPLEHGSHKPACILYDLVNVDREML